MVLVVVTLLKEELFKYNELQKQMTPTDMSSQSTEAAIETMVLAHEGLVAEVG